MKQLKCVIVFNHVDLSSWSDVRLCMFVFVPVIRVFLYGEQKGTFYTDVRCIVRDMILDPRRNNQ